MFVLFNLILVVCIISYFVFLSKKWGKISGEEKTLARRAMHVHGGWWPHLIHTQDQGREALVLGAH